MIKMAALALAALLPFLGLAGIGPVQQAQAQQAELEVDGIIQSVDCQDGSMTLSANDGLNTIDATNDTAVLINTTSVPFCSLEGFVGAPATAWLQPNGDQFYASQIDVNGPAAGYPTVVTEGYDPVPIWGTVLGTVVFDGLVYLMVHSPDGGYYRYPYYGAYYYEYYEPNYQPYNGWWPSTAPIVTVASLIAGTVLGIVAINNLQYILSNDGGHLYRYPYWGPYENFYRTRYGATYHQYNGSYVTSGAYLQAPVRQGEQHWDASAQTINHAFADAPATVREIHQATHPVVASRPAPALTPAARPVPTRDPIPAHQPASNQGLVTNRQPTPAFRIPVRPQQPAQQPQRPTPNYQPTTQEQRPTFQPVPQEQRPNFQPTSQQQNPFFRQPTQQPQRPNFQPAPQQQNPFFRQPTPQLQRPAFQQAPQQRSAPQPQRQAPSRQSCGGNNPCR
jgi:hypothetical protein